MFEPLDEVKKGSDFRSCCCTEILIHISSGTSQELIAIDRDSRWIFGGNLDLFAYNYEGFVMIILFATKGLNICYKIKFLSRS